MALLLCNFSLGIINHPIHEPPERMPMQHSQNTVRHQLLLRPFVSECLCRIMDLLRILLRYKFQILIHDSILFRCPPTNHPRPLLAPQSYFDLYQTFGLHLNRKCEHCSFVPKCLSGHSTYSLILRSRN